jgi:hypothetical protein
MKNYSKMEGVPDWPPLHSKRLELYFSHVETGSLTHQAATMPITSEPSQSKGTGESGGLPFKDYMDTSTFPFQCFPHQHYW